MPLLAIIHNSVYGFECPNCKKKFTISWFTNFITPHFFNVKYLKCPKCRKWGWSRTILRKNMIESNGVKR